MIALNYLKGGNTWEEKIKELFISEMDIVMGQEKMPTFLDKDGINLLFQKMEKISGIPFFKEYSESLLDTIFAKEGRQLTFFEEEAQRKGIYSYDSFFTLTPEEITLLQDVHLPYRGCYYCDNTYDIKYIEAKQECIEFEKDNIQFFIEVFFSCNMCNSKCSFNIFTRSPVNNIEQFLTERIETYRST